MERQPSQSLAVILSKRDPKKYKAIVERAALNGYHDHKFCKIPGHPEFGDCDCPKMQLVEDLSQFPELNDIREQVMVGVFDDEADNEDAEEMRSWLLDDNAADVFFEQLGLKVPDEAERICHLRNKRNARKN